MNAPSAMNEQPWHFVVLEGEMMQKYLEMNKNVPKGAPVGILVCADTSLEKAPGMQLCYLDCSAATQNILLAAHAKGLGAVWTAVFPNVVDENKKLLHLPDRVIPFSFIPIGYPAAAPTGYTSRFDESRIHRNTW